MYNHPWFPIKFWTLRIIDLSSSKTVKTFFEFDNYHSPIMFRNRITNNIIHTCTVGYISVLPKYLLFFFFFNTFYYLEIRFVHKSLQQTCIILYITFVIVRTSISSDRKSVSTINNNFLVVITIPTSIDSCRVIL